MALTAAQAMAEPAGNDILASLKTYNSNNLPGSKLSALVSVESKNDFGTALIKIQILNNKGIEIRQATSAREITAGGIVYVYWQTILPETSGNYSIALSVYSSHGTLLYQNNDLYPLVLNDTGNKSDKKMFGTAIIEKIITSLELQSYGQRT